MIFNRLFKKRKTCKSPFDLSINDYFKMQKELKGVKSGPSRSLECSLILAKYLMPTADLNSLPAERAMKLLSGMTVDTVENGGSLPSLPGCKMVKKMSELTIAQFIDLQMSINKIETNPEYALSVFIIPEGHKYNDGYDAEAHIKWLRDNVTIGESNCTVNFFLKRCLKYMHRTLLYFKLKTMMTRTPKKEKLIKKAKIAAYDALITQIRSIRGSA